MAIIPPFFMDAVVALGIKTPEQKMNWIGTGFLVGRKETSDPSRSTIYIITNKHVVNNQSKLYVRFNHSGAACASLSPWANPWAMIGRNSR